MQNKESLVKETKSLLQTAQKEVTREMNSQKSFFSKLFSGNALEALKTAQSNIAKALNNLESFNESGTQAERKLQANLGERDTKIKSLEEELTAARNDASTLSDRIKFLENQQAKLEAEKIELKEEDQTPSAPLPEQAPVISNEEVKKLEEEKEKLQFERAEINDKYQSTKKDLKDAQNLAIEFNKRLARLKTEILVS